MKISQLQKICKQIIETPTTKPKFITDNKPTHRTFDTGATRDSDTGKLEYSRYINPLADYSFAEYMKSKQIIGGEYRRGDNRQKWIPTESLFDSLVRHIEIVKLLRKWHNVIEAKFRWEVMLFIDKYPEEAYWYENIDEKSMVNELNAIRFNSEALKLSILQSKDTDDNIN